MEDRKEPKKARVVEVDTSKVLDWDTYDDLLRHARNSSMWYLGRFASHTSKIRQRLADKGYPREDVRYLSIGGDIETANIIDETIVELQLLHMLDDELYIESKIKSSIAKGKGTSLVVRELKFSGIPEEEIEAVLEGIEGELDDSLMEAVAKAAEKIMRSSPFRKADKAWQKSMVLSGNLRAKGFDREVVDSWMESNSEIFEDE